MFSIIAYSSGFSIDAYGDDELVGLEYGVEVYFFTKHAQGDIVGINETRYYDLQIGYYAPEWWTVPVNVANP